MAQTVVTTNLFVSCLNLLRARMDSQFEAAVIYQYGRQDETN